MRSLPNTSTHGQQWELNPRPDFKVQCPSENPEHSLCVVFTAKSEADCSAAEIEEAQHNGATTPETRQAEPNDE